MSTSHLAKLYAYTWSHSSKFQVYYLISQIKNLIFLHCSFGDDCCTQNVPINQCSVNAKLFLLWHFKIVEEAKLMTTFGQLLQVDYVFMHNCTSFSDTNFIQTKKKKKTFTCFTAVGVVLFTCNGHLKLEKLMRVYLFWKCC